MCTNVYRMQQYAITPQARKVKLFKKLCMLTTDILILIFIDRLFWYIICSILLLIIWYKWLLIRMWWNFYLCDKGKIITKNELRYLLCWLGFFRAHHRAQDNWPFVQKKTEKSNQQDVSEEWEGTIIERLIKCCRYFLLQ